MHLMFTLDDNGNRVYTLKKITPEGKMTKSAHPGIGNLSSCAFQTMFSSFVFFDETSYYHSSTLLTRRQVLEAQDKDQATLWCFTNAAPRKALLKGGSRPGRAVERTVICITNTLVVYDTECVDRWIFEQ